MLCKHRLQARRKMAKTNKNTSVNGWPGLAESKIAEAEIGLGAAGEEYKRQNGTIERRRSWAFCRVSQISELSKTFSRARLNLINSAKGGMGDVLTRGPNLNKQLKIKLM